MYYSEDPYLSHYGVKTSPTGRYTATAVPSHDSFGGYEVQFHDKYKG